MKASVTRSGSRIFKDKASMSKLEMSLDYVFGKGTSKALKSQELEFEYSRRTGRLRYVVSPATGETLFTFRSNGSVAPTIAGAQMLLNPLSKIRSRPRWTVTVIDGVSQVVSQGKTVFCKHVAYCSNELKPCEDVAILNEKGTLLAVGRTVVSGRMMKQFKRGPAIKVREGRGNLGSDEL